MEKYLFTNNELNYTLQYILSEKDIRDHIYIVGGISIYLDNQIKSIRRHHDFDFYVDVHDMPKIRYGLEKINAITLNDSLLTDGEESGIDVLINGIKIEFIPFELIDNKIKIIKKYYDNIGSWQDGGSVFLNGKTLYEAFETVTLYNSYNIKKIKTNILYAIKKYLYDNKINTREKDYQDLKYLENNMHINLSNIMYKNDIDIFL